MTARVFIAVLVAIALAASLLRFVNLQNRVFWKDEAIAALHASGHTETEFERAFVDGREHTVAQMRPYQGRTPQRSAAAVVRSIAVEDPEHPPFYYLLLFFWQSAFGSSIFAQRALSAAIGVALIPAFYWLCIELFACRRTALIAAALAAVSPYFFAYSQQLREYGLLAVITALSGALLLRAERSGDRKLWLLYAIVSIAGLYTDVLFIFALTGEVLYALICSSRAGAGRAGLVFLAALAAYAPWLWTIASHWNVVAAGNEWSADRWPLGMLAGKWIFNAGTAFFDLEYQHPWLAALLIPVFLVAAYAVIFVVTRCAAQQKWFIACLALPSGLTFVFSDLLLHAHRSAVTRYGALFYLGLLLCAAALLGNKTGLPRHRLSWQAATACLIVAGFACCLASARSPAWWDNHEDDSVPAIAAQIDAAASPVIVAPAPPKMIFTLAFRLTDNVRVVFPNAASKQLPPVDGDAFLVTTDGDRATYLTMVRGLRLTPLYVAGYNALWQTFHRPLTQETSFVGAAGAKLSIWRIARDP